MNGMIIFSYALSEEEPNPCNQKIAAEAKRILAQENDEIKVVAQWEAALGLKEIGLIPDKVVRAHRTKGVYLDGEEVLFQAAGYFRPLRIKRVILVAHPFLQLQKYTWLAKRKFSLKVLRKKIHWIGFYKDSLQWWTRGLVRSFIYAVLTAFGFRGKHIKVKGGD